MGAFTVLYDACVLYPAPLRDLLIRLARTDLFRARWTDAIHDEWIRNLLKNRPDLRPEQLSRTRELMDCAVPDCLVRNYNHLINSLVLPDPNDRHVLAAAIAGGASMIVTTNLKHFPAEALAPYGIEGAHPDDFIVLQFDLSATKVCNAVKEHRASLRNPPKNVEEYLSTLSQLRLPETVARLTEYAALI